MASPHPQTAAYGLAAAWLCILSACTPAAESTDAAASAPEAASSAIAAQILAESGHQDFLVSSKQAMADVNASDIAELSASDGTWPAPLPANTETLSASDLAALPPLPPACQQYFQRTRQCFARQGEDSTVLLQDNTDAEQQIRREQPDDAACQALNRSFDGLAVQLGCE